MVENIFPYELPENWQWSTLGDVARIFTGNSINEKIKHEKYFGKTDGMTYIATKDVGFDNVINYDTNIKIPESENFKVAPKDTTLLCIEGGSAGKKIGFTNQPVCFVNKLCAFVSDEIYSKLIYFFMQTEIFLNQFNAKKHGLIGGVSIKNLAEILIPLPPLDEQKRIVAIIERLFSKLDAAKSIVQKVLDGYELRRAAILHKAFTGELTKNFRAEHGLTLDDWQQKTLGDVLELSTQKINSFNENLKYVGLENIEKDGGKINFQSAKDVKSTKNIFHSGDLLYGKLRPYLNKHGIPNFDGVCSTDILVLNVNKLSANEFINYFFSLPKFIEYAVSNSKGINLPRVAAQIILQAEINLPPSAEQKEIVRVLDILLDKEQRTKEIAEKTLAEIDLLKRTILARAFRGELGTNNPSEKLEALY